MSKRPKTANAVMSRLRRPAGRLRDMPIWSKLGLIMLAAVVLAAIMWWQQGPGAAAVTVATPAREPGTRARIARPQSRLAATAGSVSGVLVNAGRPKPQRLNGSVSSRLKPRPRRNWRG